MAEFSDVLLDIQQNVAVAVEGIKGILHRLDKIDEQTKDQEARLRAIEGLRPTVEGNTRRLDGMWPNLWLEK